MTSRLIVFNNWSAGMFSMVKSVLCALARCEAEGVEPTVVVENSPFREDGYKGNVWDRFFLPIGDPARAHDERVEISGHPCLPHNDCYFHNRVPMNALVARWVRPVPVIQQRIDAWGSLLGSSLPRVGVHFRGSDKHHECSFVHPVHYLEALRCIRGPKRDPWVLCTDCSGAVSVFEPEPGMILTDSERVAELQSGYGVHFRAKDRGKAGSDAILDAWLLSKCHLMICGPSNLSEFVTYLNPSIVLVSMR